MKRRDFIALIGSAAVAPTLALPAQPLTVPLVGFLNSASPDNYAFNAAAFREGLREAGYVDGQNVTIEYRWASGNYDQLPALATELVNRNVAVIAATGDIASARAAQAATRRIPIVFTVGADPTRFGLVDSLSRPGGNATGITLFSSTLSAKRMELLREIAPNATLIALFMNPDNLNVNADIKAAQEGRSRPRPANHGRERERSRRIRCRVQNGPTAARRCDTPGQRPDVPWSAH